MPAASLLPFTAALQDTHLCLSPHQHLIVLADVANDLCVVLPNMDYSALIFLVSS